MTVLAGLQQHMRPHRPSLFWFPLISTPLRAACRKWSHETGKSLESNRSVGVLGDAPFEVFAAGREPALLEVLVAGRC